MRCPSPVGELMTVKGVTQTTLIHLRPHCCYIRRRLGAAIAGLSSVPPSFSLREYEKLMTNSHSYTVPYAVSKDVQGLRGSLYLLARVRSAYRLYCGLHLVDHRAKTPHWRPTFLLSPPTSRAAHPWRDEIKTKRTPQKHETRRV